VAKRLAGEYVLKLAVFNRNSSIYDRELELPVLEANEIRKVSFCDFAAKRKIEFPRRIFGYLSNGIRERQKAVFRKQQER
jgi:hypothetical protein